MNTKVISWSDGKGNWGVVGVFDDDDMANAVFDALVRFAGAYKQYYMDDFKLNEVKK